MSILDTKKIAVIGTAGRTEREKYNKELWDNMKKAFHQILSLNQGATLISGGAAWSDHLAVWAYNNNLCDGLILHLPAPFDIEKIRFTTKSDREKSAASSANYYLKLFSEKIGEDAFSQITNSIKKGAVVTEEPHQLGYRGMFSRNDKIANSENLSGLISFSMGGGDTPNSKGTLHTWERAKTNNKLNIDLEKIHLFISL